MLVIALAVLGSGCSNCGEGNVNTNQTVTDLKWTEKLSDDQQKITTAVGRGPKPYQGTPSEMASQFLKENQDRLRLSASLDDLRVLNEKARKFGANVEFQQIWNGLPVENGRIQINFDREGYPVQVASSYMPTANASDQTTVTKEQAEDAVLAEFVRTTPDEPSKSDQQEGKSSAKTIERSELKLTEDPKIEDVFFARRGLLRRAYQITVKAEQPFGIKQFVTDANSGEILRVRDFVYNAVEGQGQIFNPNPINTLNNPTPTPANLNDSDSAVSTANPNPYYTRPLLDLDASTAPFTLRGPFVVIENLRSPNILPVSEGYPNFIYRRSHDGFEEVMVYYHIDTMQRYIRNLGFMDVVKCPIRADAHGLVSDNSRYISEPVGEGYLAFGDGGVDDAEDADVIAHEYGHAMQDSQAPGKYSTTGIARAMGEGFGDYWAVSSFAAQNVESGHDLACVMEWDAVPSCKRRVDNNLKASNFDPAAYEWKNGQIWSRTLFQIFNQLGKDTTDRLIIQSHNNIFDYDLVSFHDGAAAIMTANEQLFTDPAVVAFNRTKLCEIFIDREIFTASDCTP